VGVNKKEKIPDTNHNPFREIRIFSFVILT
jgi:hypothetical protein